MIYEEELAEANINWTYDEKYNRQTKDIVSLAKEQNKMYFNSWQKVQFYLEVGYFDDNNVKISLWQNEKKIDLEIDNAGPYFNLPTEKGEYIIILHLPTDKGTAQNCSICRKYHHSIISSLKVAITAKERLVKSKRFLVL